MNLMVDGRIHPGRIEELYEKAQAEVARMILEAGERAVERANVRGLSPRVIETLGKLRFRTSYAQNVPRLGARLPGKGGGESFRLALYRKNQEYQAAAGYLAGLALLVWKVWRQVQP